MCIEEAELFSFCRERAVATRAYPSPQSCEDVSFSASSTTPIAVTTNGGSCDRCKCLLEFNSNPSHRVAYENARKATLLESATQNRYTFINVAMSSDIKDDDKFFAHLKRHYLLC